MRAAEAEDDSENRVQENQPENEARAFPKSPCGFHGIDDSEDRRKHGRDHDEDTDRRGGRAVFVPALQYAGQQVQREADPEKFHAPDNPVSGIFVIDRNDAFPARLAGLLEDFPIRDDFEDEKNQHKRQGEYAEK